MSADNYLYVRRREDGKFGVSMRFASSYYKDEGHTVESIQEHYDLCEPGKYQIADDWLENAPEDSYGVFDSPTEALAAAHKAEMDEYIVEYGVSVGGGVLL